MEEGGQTWRILAWRGVRHKGGKDIRVRRGAWRGYRHGGDKYRGADMEGA